MAKALAGFDSKRIMRAAAAGSWSGPGAGIDDQRVVALGPQAVIMPALAAEIAGQVVIVGAQVHGPPRPQGVEDEPAQVQVAVIGLVVAGLESEEQRLGILPLAAQDSDFGAAEVLVQRQTGGRSGPARGVAPEQVQGGGRGDLALVPGVDRLVESARQPEHLRAREWRGRRRRRN